MESGVHNRSEIGRTGEDIACALLASMGHTVLERNWRTGHLEIDIISCDPEGIHFVEVKTRRSGIQAPPQDNVDKAKQRKLAKAASKYLKTGKGLPYGDMECFFDVVAVRYEDGEYRTEWFPQAFIPIYL